jgi:hypothetical protein
MSSFANIAKMELGFIFDYLARTTFLHHNMMNRTIKMGSTPTGTTIMGWASHYIEKLRNGETVKFRPRGNSMQPKIESGQLCTVEPLPLAVSMIKFIPLYVSAVVVLIVYVGALRGAGDTFWAMLITTGIHWITTAAFGCRIKIVSVLAEL